MKEQLIVDNLKLVNYVISKMNIKDLNKIYEDIYQEGVIGLIKATTTYDSSFNLQFSTYAYKCIKNEILYYFRKNNKKCISLDKEITEDVCMKDLIQDTRKQPEEILEDLEINNNLYLIISNYLNDMERNVINKLFGINNNTLTQRELANKYSISQAQVSRIKNKSLDKMKNWITIL